MNIRRDYDEAAPVSVAEVIVNDRPTPILHQAHITLAEPASVTDIRAHRLRRNDHAGLWSGVLRTLGV